jgi:serine/threonine protein kinase
MQTYVNDSPLRQIVKCDGLAFDLLEKMLVYNPEKRISAAQALRHPYFNQPPVCVINIARRIPTDEWKDLVAIGRRTSDS